MPESKKILIAEDEKPMARAMQMKLQKAGFEALTVHDGAAAVEAATQTAYDLILLDLIMPKKDGFTVLEELQKAGNKAPIFVLTNLSQPEDNARTQALGAKQFIVKSNTPILEIVEMIQKELAQQA